MKELKNVTVFKCEFCTKKLFRKNAMQNHEIKCTKNPLNIRPCFECSHLEKIEIEYEPSVQLDEGLSLLKSSCFKCNKKDVFMFPPKYEHSKKGGPSFTLHKGDEIIQESMPKECSLYSTDMNGGSINIHDVFQNL